MPARVESFPQLPRRQPERHPIRQVLAPLIGWACVAAALALVRRLTRQPSLPRMSDQWLASHHYDRDEY